VSDENRPAWADWQPRGVKDARNALWAYVTSEKPTAKMHLRAGRAWEYINQRLEDDAELKDPELPIELRLAWWRIHHDRLSNQ
jgi:hypothetical protein